MPPTMPSDPREGEFTAHGRAAITVNKQLSIPLQDLSDDKLLGNAPKAEVDGRMVPRVGKIPLLARLGTGGMSAVYYGINPSLRLEVAVKVLPLFMAERDPVLIERFFREAQTAARVRSPHLVYVSDVDEENRLFYIVMEFVSGLSGAQYLKNITTQGGAGLKEEDALAICIAATKGLAAAHAEDIVHRDVKPANILIPWKKDGQTLAFEHAKLADLGLARGIEEDQSALTGSFQVMGTPGYMSPEQVHDAKSAGKPADVWGMGATLYALLAGRAPFAGSNSMNVLHDTVEKPHRAVSAARSDVRMELEAVIDKCLAKDPAKRYPDAQTMLDALLEVWPGKKQGAYKMSTDARRSALAKTVMLPKPATGKTSAKRSGMRKAVTSATVVKDMPSTVTDLKAVSNALEKESGLLPATDIIDAGEPTTSVVWSHVVYEGWPFKESEAIERRRDTARATKLPERRVFDLKGRVPLEMNLLPAGRFLMGSPHDEPEREKDELTHYVTLTRPFYMAVYPMTQGQWMAVLNNNPSRFKDVADNDQRPVERVTWTDVQIKLLPALQKLAPKGWVFRLPTEAEWEYACRAGSPDAFYFGEQLKSEHALVKFERRDHGTWVYRRVDRINRPGPGKEWNETAPVGSYPPNAFGLHDMHGNVMEWCLDTYNEDFYASDKAINPVHLDDSGLRILRGGSWNYSARYARSAKRYQSSPDSRYFNFGVRLVLAYDTGE